MSAQFNNLSRCSNAMSRNLSPSKSSAAVPYRDHKSIHKPSAVLLSYSLAVPLYYYYAHWQAVVEQIYQSNLAEN